MASWTIPVTRVTSLGDSYHGSVANAV